MKKLRKWHDNKCPECKKEMEEQENDTGTEIILRCFDCDIAIDSDGGSF